MERASHQDTETASSQNGQVALPSRKRSIEAADLPETADGGRGKSKRIRARISIVDDVRQPDGKVVATSDYEWKIQESILADGPLFDTLVRLGRKTGIDATINVATALRAIVTSDSPQLDGEVPNDVGLGQAILDFYGAVQSWDDTKATILLRSRLTDDSAADHQRTGLLAFLEHTKASAAPETCEAFDIDLSPFVQRINNGWYDVDELALAWITVMYSAAGSRWPYALKQTIMQMMVFADESLVEWVTSNWLEPDTAEVADELSASQPGFGVAELAQGLFELHLDIYSRIITPVSDVDVTNREKQRARLVTWCEIARSLIHNLVSAGCDRPSDELLDTLALRHLWTSVFHLGISEAIERDHFVLCIEDLKNEMIIRRRSVIYLRNSAIFPEISVAAADREISKLKTMDFFLGIFQKDGKEPVDIIEDLEPLLEQATHQDHTDKHVDAHEPSHTGQEGRSDVASAASDDPVPKNTTQVVLSKFLKGASVSLRLLLWQRLREAYEAINYPTKVLSICLQIIRVLMNELKMSEHLQKTKEEREILILGWLRDCGELVAKSLALMDEDFDVFECIDVDHLRSSISAILELWNLLYAVALFDDYSQAGQKGGSSVNPFRFYPSELFHTASIKFHDMQVQTCLVLYRLFREAMAQMPQNFPNAVEDRLQFLRQMHYFFGVRRLCKASDSLFLQFSKDELLSLPDLNRQSSDDLAQVLYDLYDLNLFSTPLERLDHGCDSDYLDRKTSLQLMPSVMDKAQRMSIKDLLKSDLGKSVEKLHTALGPVKSNTFAAVRNRRLLQAYLRSLIRPIDLLLCMDGIGEVSAVPMSLEDALVASQGWFFLKGQIALAKHRAQRVRGSQGSEDELHIAIAFFLQDLEFSVDRWEGWFRLAQSYHSLLEEQVSWSAEKTNNQQEDLVHLQRSAIHAYVMAVAAATRTAEPSGNTSSMFAEMYYDFGILIYSATRQPFSMRAFTTKDYPEKHYSDPAAPGGKYTSRPFKTLRSASAWKFATALFRRAANYNPNNWM